MRCYPKWRRRNPNAMRKKGLRLMRRGIGDAVEQRCTTCLGWFPIEKFSRDRRAKHGRYTKCKVCVRKRQKAWDKRTYKRRKYVETKRVAKEKRLDREHKTRVNNRLSPYRAGEVPTQVVAEMVAALESTFPDDQRSVENVAAAAKIPVRRLWGIKNRESPRISFDVAERVAMAAGQKVHDRFLADFGPETGMSGWGPREETACERCGTWWRRHYARGLCHRCYHAWHWAKTNNRPLLPPRNERWAKLWVFCRLCETRARPHQAHGLCTRCWSRIRARAERNHLDFKTLLVAEVREKRDRGEGVVKPRPQVFDLPQLVNTL